MVEGASRGIAMLWNSYVMYVLVLSFLILIAFMPLCKMGEITIFTRIYASVFFHGRNLLRNVTNVVVGVSV